MMENLTMLAAFGLCLDNGAIFCDKIKKRAGS